MRDFQNIDELEARIVSDRQKYSEIERLVADLTETISRGGFRAASDEVKYRGEKEALGNAIRVAKEMLADAKDRLIRLMMMSHDRWNLYS